MGLGEKDLSKCFWVIEVSLTCFSDKDCAQQSTLWWHVEGRGSEDLLETQEMRR